MAAEGLGWPRPLTVGPRTVVWVATAIVATAWGVVLSVDLLGWIPGLGVGPMWPHLFNDRPVEWAQWLFLGAAILAAGFTAGRCTEQEDRGVRAFLLVLAAGLVLMLFEDAGDARHVISSYVAMVAGESVFGLPYRVVSDVPYFLVIAALPMYAALRYGREVWRAPSSRRYLVAAYGLYALAGGSSGIRHLGGLYITIGGFIDRVLLGGRFPMDGGLTQERVHFLLVDSLIEESIETLAAASMLAAVLAVGADLRATRLRPRSAPSGPPAPPKHRSAGP